MSGAALVLGLAGTLLVGCGSTGTHQASPAGHSTTTVATPTSGTTSTSTTTVAPITTVAPSTTTVTPTTTGSAGTPTCSTGQLKITTAPVSGGLSHVGVALVLTNEGAVCSLGGYPGVDGANNGTPAVAAVRTLRGYLGGLSSGTMPTTVTLGTGQSASALLEGLEEEVSSQPCPSYTSLIVTPPNETQSTTIPGGTFCSPEIHPVVPGTTGDGTAPA